MFGQEVHHVSGVQGLVVFFDVLLLLDPVDFKHACFHLDDSLAAPIGAGYLIDWHLLHDAYGLQLVAKPVEVFVEVALFFEAGDDGVLGGEAVLERVVADGGTSGGSLGPLFFPFWRLALNRLSVAVVLYRFLA